MFQEFREKGLCVIPLKDGRPLVAWGKYFDRLPDTEEIARFNGFEYGLVCGAVSGVIGVDIDTDDTAKIERLCGVSPVKKVGSKGFTAFFKYSAERTQSWKTPAGEVICEILSDKHLTTIPPSPHRVTGKPYVWVDGTALGDVDLPVLPDDFITLMDAKYPKPPKPTRPANYLGDERKVDLDEAERMLGYITPDLARDEWVQIGMALRDEFGDLACNLWHDWSGRSNKYNVRDCQAAWRSFGGTGVTIGTLIHFARQSGYQEATPAFADRGFDVDLSYIYNKYAPPEPDAQPTITVTGLTGEIADWITSTAIRPQPVLSLAAALVFMGALKGHRFRGHTNLRTNIYALSLAPTAAGKDHPQKAIARLMRAVGLERVMGGKPTSGTGLLTGINKAGGVSLVCIDEVGRYMGNINMKNSAGHQREISDYMVELFSTAGDTFYGRQYANEKQNPQVILQQPHFCCLGSTVPEKLQSACSSAEVIDGFLNRWLVFSANDRPEKTPGLQYLPPPEELVNKIRYFIEINPVDKDNYTSEPNPKEIRFTPEAWNMMQQFEKRMILLLDATPYPINQLYARSPEHVEKISMTICDDEFIGTQEVRTAIAIVEQSNSHIVKFAASIVDNQHEADVVYILSIIEKWPGISRNQLTQRTRKINHRLRSDILNQLIEGGEIYLEKRNGGDVFTRVRI